MLTRKSASEPTQPSETALAVKGDGTVKKLSLEEVKNLETVEGWGGLKDSVGNITGPFEYKGVPFTAICDLVEGLSSSQAVRVTSSDGYSMTFSYEQVKNGDFVTYDPSTGNEVSTSGLRLVLVYEEEGKPYPEKHGGPLRVGIIDGQNQVTDGHWWVKWVENVEIVSVGGESWSISLEGAISEEIDRATFESGAAPNCHGITWTDDEGNEWTGIPLYLLAGRVDDNNRHMGGAFNDELADENAYQVEAIAEDGYSAKFSAAEIDRNEDILIAYQKNGEPLPEDDSPLRVVGPNLSGKRKVSKISKIKLNFKEGTGEGWSISLEGEISREMSQEMFKTAVNMHGKTYTDEGDEWKGLPLWRLVAQIDDEDEMDFNDKLAEDNTYEVEVIAEDDYSVKFSSLRVARNDNIIVANQLNGEPLPEDDEPLRVVGPNLSGREKVSKIAKISVISTTSSESWSLTLKGETTEEIGKETFESIVQQKGVTYTCQGGYEWSGVPLWHLLGRIDDDDPDSFNEDLANQGYTVKVIASDDYSKKFESSKVAKNDDIILANKMDGEPLLEEDAPLRLVGPNLLDSEKVSMVNEIELIFS